MSRQSRGPRPALPAGWKRFVKSAILQTISLAHFAIARSRCTTATHSDPGLRTRTEDERREQELSLWREETRIKDARMAQIPAHQRPRYAPTERLAILELKAARGLSLAQTARRFQVTPATIASWQRRVDEDGPEALVKTSHPVNKFPQFVGYLTRRLKVLCPTLGKRKIAAMLARAGLHLGVTTVTRMLHDETPPRQTAPSQEPKNNHIVTAKRPNHVWHVDLTTAPIGGGFWCSWSPLALPQCWPFSWWAAVVVDHFSRRVMGVATFAKQPSSEAVRAFVGRTIDQTKATPKYIICDRGPQFDNRGFRRWCRRRGVTPRYGAIGQHGSIAIVERFIRTLKESLRQLPLIPMWKEKVQRELSVVREWYNEHRPHETLAGRTPNESNYNKFPAHRKPRHEPRDRWPRGSPCAMPWVLTRGRPGARLELEVAYFAGRKHLPIVALRRVA